MIQTVPQIVFPQNQCLGSNPAKMFCKNQACSQFAFICINQACQHCEKVHQNCQTLWISALNRKIQQKRQIMPETISQGIKQMENIYEEAMTKFAQEKEHLKNQYQFYGLGKVEAHFVKLMMSGKIEQIKGSLIYKVLKALPLQDKFSNDEQTLKRAWGRKQKELDKVIEYFRQVQLRPPRSIESKITKDTQIISSFFDRPIIHYELLYRASQQNFAVSTFHQKCDGKKNTLLLAKTQHGKIIGAFTTLPWTSNGTYGYDNANQSQLKTFLFSVTQKQKFTCKNPQNAIYGNSSYGPTFGGGHDLYICNGANSANSSYTNFGHSYNTGDKPPNNQQAYEFFTGAKSGYNVRFTEWQMYQIEL